MPLRRRNPFSVVPASCDIPETIRINNADSIRSIDIGSSNRTFASITGLEGSSILSEFSVPNDPQILTCAMYVALRELGPLCSVTNTPAETKFIFIQTPNTEQLKLQSNFQCGESLLPIQWLQDMIERSSSWLPFKNPSSPDEPLEQSPQLVLNGPKQPPSRLYTEPLWRLEMFFPFYDSTFDTVDLDKFHSKNVVLGLIQNHCPNLTELKCSILDKQLELHALANRIQKLRLSIWTNDIDGLLVQDARLEELEITSAKGWAKLPAVKLANLVKLTLNRVTDLLDVQTFLLLNNQLQMLSFDDTRSMYPNIDMPVFHQRFIDDFSCFRHLVHLKTLHFHCKTTQIGAILQVLIDNGIALETLEINSPNGVFEYSVIAQMPSIKFLSLQCFNESIKPIEDHEAVQLAVNLENLQEINMSSWCKTFTAALHFLQLLSANVRKVNLMIRLDVAVFACVPAMHGFDGQPCKAREHDIEAIGELVQSRGMQLMVLVKGDIEAKDLKIEDQLILNKHSDWLRYSRHLRHTTFGAPSFG